MRKESPRDLPAHPENRLDERHPSSRSPLNGPDARRRLRLARRQAGRSAGQAVVYLDDVVDRRVHRSARTNEGVGPIRIYASLDSIRQLCPIVRDTTVQPQPGLAAEHLVSVLMGTDTAVVSVRRNRVVQVFLTSPHFATADSIGVGTTLGRLLRFAQVKGYGVRGDLLIDVPAKCGLTFGITGRYPDLPDGLKDTTTLSRVPVSATVNRIRIDGCDPAENAESAPDDSTYDVQTDSVFLARDLDGNGVTDFVISESRPYQRSRTMTARRVVVYLDSIRASRRPQWSSGWDMEGEAMFGSVHPLAHGSMLLLTLAVTPTTPRRHCS